MSGKRLKFPLHPFLHPLATRRLLASGSRLRLPYARTVSCRTGSLLPPSSTTRSIHRVSWQFAKQLVCAIDPSCLPSSLPSFLPYPLSSVLPSWAHPLLVDRPHASSWCSIFLSVSHPCLPASISKSTPAAPAPSGDRESAVASEHPSISLFPRLALITNAKHPFAVRGPDRA